MPLNEKGRRIKAAMVKSYGADKGPGVFYGAEQKGTITGVTQKERAPSRLKHRVTGR